MTKIKEYLKKLFTNKPVVFASIYWARLVSFLFPTTKSLAAAKAVLIIMVVDLFTKIFALVRQNGGLILAIRAKSINSSKLAKGTFDKLIVFGIMLIICGSSYNVLPIKDLSIWFTQTMFTLMFLRDTLSIIENLRDANIAGLGPLKKAVENKISKVVDKD